jgi:hypothetical protein
MNPTSALLQKSNPLLAILWAAFTCGGIDITPELVVYGHFGHPLMLLLQGIAAGVARLAVVRRGASNGVPRFFWSFFHRAFCHCLPYGQSPDPFPSGARGNLWCFLWRCCLLLHESRRGATVGRHKICVLSANDGDRCSHTHLLCGATHCPRGTTMFNFIKMTRFAPC